MLLITVDLNLQTLRTSEQYALSQPGCPAPNLADERDPAVQGSRVIVHAYMTLYVLWTPVAESMNRELIDLEQAAQ